MQFTLALLQNAAFLLALVLIYQVLSGWHRRPAGAFFEKVVPGLAVGGIACVIMLTPIEVSPGIIFDTRSVLIGLCGLFFGPIPTLVTMVVASAMRLHLGGMAAWTGVSVILATGMAGLTWRHFRGQNLHLIKPGELLLFGLVTHVIMLALMFTLPAALAYAVLAEIALPVLVLYPLVTLLLGSLLAHGERITRTDEDLRAKKEQLTLALSASHQILFDANLRSGAISFDADGSQNHLKINETVEQWLEDVHPDDQERVAEIYATILSGQTLGCQFTYRERTNAGEWAWLLVAGRVVSFDERGKPARMLGTFTDVTVRHEAEHRLTIFRNLIDHSMDGFEIVDPEDGRLIDVNEASCREMGYTRDELLALTVFEIEAELKPDGFHAVVGRLREEGALSWKGVHLRKDGTTYPVEIKFSLVLLDRDYIVAAVRNVAEREAMEQSIMAETWRRQNLIEQSRDGIVTLDASGNVFEANKAFADMLGYTKAEVENLAVWDWERNLPREAVEEMIAAVDEHGDHFETRHTRKDGAVIDVEISTNATIINGRKLIFCVSRDITERKQTQASLQLAAMVYQNSREAMMVTDREGVIVAINPAFTEITGYTLEEVRGRTPRLLHSGQHGPDFYESMWSRLNEKGHWSGEIFNRRKNGEVYPESLSINAVYGENGELQSWVAQFSDITEKKGAEHLIWQQANFDSLTSLPNRRMFQDRLGQEIRKAKRSGTSVGLLFLDLDNFKEVNDSLGHDMGDRLLQQTAERLRGCMRETDVIARLGGDEFTILLSDVQDDTDVGGIAQKILWRLSEPFSLDSEMAYVSASVGITLYPADADDSEGLLKCADQAMYGAKEGGRNCYRYFTVAMQDAVVRRMRMANDLREAVASGQFFVVYQPVVDLRDGQVRKAEALVRWNHPREGVLQPAKFISIAEDCGLIGSIGSIVLDDAIRQCKRWLQLVPGMQVSINKSPAEFDVYGRGEQSDPTIALLRDHGLPGGSLVVEITEGMLLSARPEILKQLLALRDAGVEVALDDFGTGYSSLSYLKTFDIDYLKIDQSFISNLGQENQDLALCEAIITMAHRLGLKVIAEGVETAEQVELLKEIGCDYAQGYLFSPPVSARDLEAFLTGQPAVALGAV